MRIVFINGIILSSQILSCVGKHLFYTNISRWCDLCMSIIQKFGLLYSWVNRLDLLGYCTFQVTALDKAVVTNLLFNVLLHFKWQMIFLLKFLQSKTFVLHLYIIMVQRYCEILILVHFASEGTSFPDLEAYVSFWVTTVLLFHI